MNETAKATRRRLLESSSGVFDWEKVFRGRGLDIGCGPDILPFRDVEGFDLPRDANHLSRYYHPGTFDYLHSSQSLEHMRHPDVIRDWAIVLKTGGYLVVTVPSWELYERMVWPSRFNPDHKSSWSMWQKGSPAPIHILVPEWLKKHEDIYEVVFGPRLVDDNYDYNLPSNVDQTYVEADGVEAFIEFVLKKKATPEPEPQ